MNRSLTLVLLITVLSLNQLSARDAGRTIFGSQRGYCIPSFDTVVPNINQLVLRGSADWWNYSNNVKVRLTNNGWQAAASWYNNAVPLNNDFRTTFRTSINAWSCSTYTTTYCRAQIFGWCISTGTDYHTDRCGGDGQAFVLHTSGFTVGGGGGGLGYTGLQNVLALEFDTYQNGENNDPWWSKEDDRHMSVILQRGAATANENSAIAWNDRPINWKNNYGGGYRDSVGVDVRIVDKVLEVYVDGSLQIGYYGNLDVPASLGSNYFFAGFTAGTGAMKEDHYFYDWVLYMDSFSAPHSSTTLSGTDSVMPNQVMTFTVNLRNSCGRYHFINNIFESAGNVGFNLPADQCQIINQINSEPFQIQVRCSKTGSYAMRFSHRGQYLANIHTINVQPGPMTGANLQFNGLSTKTIDETISFKILPYDDYNNIATTSEAALRNYIKVEWPNPGDSQTDYKIVKAADGTYDYTISSNKVGDYKILFNSANRFIAAGKWFSFKFDFGKVSKDTSTVTLVPTSNSTDPKMGVAGQSYQLQIVAKDKGFNVLPIDKVDVNSFKVEQFCNGKLDKSVKDLARAGTQYASTHKLTSTGNFNFKAAYSTLDLACSNCDVMIKPAVADFESSKFYQFDSVKKDFVAVGKDIVMAKTSNGKVRFILTDNYANAIATAVPEDFEMKVSGNSMNEIKLCLASGGPGAIDGSVCDGDDSTYFKRLAGVDGYIISITQKSVTKTKEYNLSLKSDGADADCGNDELNLLRTTTEWLVNPPSGVWGYAGETYTLKLCLKTTSLKRYCDWALETSKITNRLLRGYTAGPMADYISDAAKYTATGCYSVDINFKKASMVARYIYFFLDGRNIQPRMLTIKQSAAYMGYVAKEYIDTDNTLVDGIIQENYPFTVYVFDKYDNPTKIENGNLDLAVTHQKNKDINLIPKCENTELGIYYCTMKAEKWGVYDIKSALFVTNTIKAYIIGFYRTEPDYLVSTGRIINDLSKPILAGSEMTYRIVPKDSAGDPFVKKETLKIVKNFAGNFVDPTGKFTEFEVSETVVDDIGNLLFTHKHTAIGKYKYAATYSGKPIICEVCSALVVSADPDLTKSKFYILATAAEGFKKPILPNEILKLDNTISVPIFIAEFYDAYGNPKTVVSGYSTSIAVLTVPGGAQATYEFASWNNQGVIQFEVMKKNLKFYQGELANENCNLEFKMKKDTDTTFTSQLFKSVILIGKKGDDQFSNDPIDPAKVIIDPTVIKIKANEQTTMKVELRTAKGKLYNHPETLGYYNDTTSQLVLGKDVLDQTLVSVANGKLKGTYIFSFTSKKAMTPTDLTVNFYNPVSKKMEDVNTKLNLEVTPADYNFLVMSQESLGDCTAGDNKAIDTAPFDEFNNAIEELDAEKSGLNAAQAGGEGKLGAVTSGKAKVGLAFKCKKAGVIKIEAPKFKEASKYNARVITNYQVNVNPGSPCAPKSMAVISKSEINAGETVIWKVFPYDCFDNKITIDEKSSLYNTADFTSKRVFKGEGNDLGVFKISDDKQYYYVEAVVTQAGYHTFQAFFKGELITAPSAKVNVNALAASFVDSSLLKKNKDLEFEAPIEKKFTHPANSAPFFMISLFDKYQNQVTAIPNGWSLGLKLTGTELNIGEQGIVFCADKTGVLFSICETGAHVKNYFDLVTNREYSMVLSNGKDAQDPYKIDIVGDKTDPEASNLPLDETNTLITPSIPLKTVAGVAVSFNIELRTTNKNLRKNSWFDKPEDNISLLFALDNGKLNYSISKGEVKGRYVVNVISKTAYTETTPNVITVSINKVKVTSVQPKLIVKPDVPATVVVSDINGKKADLAVANIDGVYMAFFLASDQFGNAVTLSADNSLNIAIDIATETYLFTKEYMNGVMKVVFQPKKPGQLTYTFDSLKISFKVELLQGSISRANSFFTIAEKTGVTIVAGNEAFVEFHPKDKWDNALVLDTKYPDVKLMQLQLLLKDPSATTFTVVDAKHDITTDKAFGILSSVLTAKGQNEFAVQLNQESVRGVLQVVTVTPGEFDFTKTKLEYFDDKESKYIQAVKSKEISEDNVNEVAIFRIRAFDQFKNELDSLCKPDDKKYIEQFSLLLSGNDYDKKKPVTFAPVKVEGNLLSFALIEDDKKRYKMGLFNTIPYALDLSYIKAKDPLTYSVTLQGRGEGDKGAEIEKPMDITKIFLSALKAEFVAGTKAQLTLEIRTSSGKRKSDAEPKFTLSFSPNDASYVTTVSNADLLGKYLITITGTKASGAAPLDLTINIDGKDFDKKVKVTITPDHVAKFSIESDTAEKGSADAPYTVAVLPFDKFMNIVYNADETDVNLQIKFPETATGIKGKTYTTTHNAETGVILYKIAATVAGEYTIKSEMIVGTMKPTFTILAGLPYYKYSTASVQPAQTVVDSPVSVQVKPFDKFNNPILKDNQPDAFRSFTFGVTWGKGESKDFALASGAGDLISGSFTLTKSGMSAIVPKLNNDVIPCNGCNVNFVPGAIDLTKTLFSQVKADGKAEQVSKVGMDAGAKNLNLRASLFDKFNNQILGFVDAETFTFTLEGNSMSPIAFTVEKLVNILGISVPETKAFDLSRLVPALNYDITLVQLSGNKEIAKASLKLDIAGKDTGAGNGPIVLANTVITPAAVVLTAGKEGTFTIELLQKDKKRFNGVCAKDFIKVEEAAGSVGSEKLKITTSLGELNCQYTVALYGIVALEEGQLKKINIIVDGNTLNTQVTADVEPDVPDFTKTVVVKPLPDNVMTDMVQEFSFKLYDTFKNPLARVEYENKLAAKGVNGNLNSTNTKLNEGIYTTYVIPLYPPRFMSYNLYYTLGLNNVITIFPTPFTTAVLTKLAPELTEVDVVQANAGDSFKVVLRLKDIKGYCFETEKKVTITIDGPFTNDKADTKVEGFYKSVEGLTAITVKPKLSHDVTRVAYECHQYYEATVLAESFTGKGYYQTNVFLEGENEGKSLKALVKITMKAGAIDATKSKIVLSEKPKGIKKDTVDELGFVVGNAVTMNVVLRDKYKNEIGESRQEKLALIPVGLKAEDIIVTEEDKLNGNHQVTLTSKKVGTISAFTLTVNKVDVVSTSLELAGFPKAMKLYPGMCSTEKPGVDNEALKKAKIAVNEKSFFSLQCYDAYGNNAEESQYNFVATFKASDIPVVKTVSLPGKVLPKGKATSKYTVGFKPSYAGVYTVNMVLDGHAYGEEFKITVTAGKCPIETPTYCVNTKKCVAGGYKACGFPELKCDGTEKPIKCKVFGDDACVRHSVECDCADPQKIKCMTDFKCITFDEEPALCSTFFFKDCPVGEQLCLDGISCRKDMTMCPSNIGCPPGHELCPDQSCTVKGVACPKFEACPPSAWNKCEDQTCQDQPTNCPTRISCPVTNSVICPDKSCAPTEVDCALPATCEGMYRCPDLSCRPSKEDCPVSVSCPNDLAYCPDGVCRESCKGTSNWRMLALVEGTAEAKGATATTETTGCAKGTIKCPGGECVANLALCPTVETCPVGSVRCADLSCETSLSSCRTATCKKGETHCWDGSCVSGIEECPTRTTCPDETPVKCPNGACTETISDCEPVASCPKSASYKCGYGECRRKAIDCPTFVTCPAELPVACVDGSCKKNQEACVENTNLFVCADDQVLCPGGACAQSKDTCPTLESCPVGFIRCWDNDCAESPDKCDKADPSRAICPSDRQVRCTDGSCASKLQNCPTQIICPPHKPIKCSDGNCRQSNEDCSKASECPLGTNKCADGSCSASICGTAITCPEGTPIKCYDNTCRLDRRDCPPMPTCPKERPVLCEEGLCVFERADCTKTKQCPSKTPVKCPDNSCVESVSDCQPSVGCPIGFTQCADSSCRKHASLCSNVECPNNLFFCPNGLCAKGEKFCDLANGCPHNKGIKCTDGSCTDDKQKCPETPKCPEGQSLCKDGSCFPANVICPELNGCMLDLPFKCADGTCIDPKVTKCKTLSCPAEKPSKCLDGTCVASHRNCPGLISPERRGQCEGEAKVGNIIPCADGSCVASSDQCRPLVECPENFARCGDGSCRPSKTLCPLAKSKCPSTKSVICSNGACAKTDQECIGANGCPLNKPQKCKYSGVCQESQAKCDDLDKKKTLRNGCTMKAPFKCGDGSCTSKKKNCVKKAKCPTEKPFRCLDDSCEATKKECQAKNFKCNEGQFRCPDNKCVAEYADCQTTKGCPINKPFNCDEGCSDVKCEANVKCPPQSPFKCLDGTCVGSSSFCNVVEGCDGDKIRCADGTCKPTLNDCELVVCPINVFVRCLDGRCVSSPEECSRLLSLKCQDEKPIRCLNGQCAAKYADCLGGQKETETAKAKRLLATVVVDPGCSEASPVRCSNGGCVKTADLCEVITGCGITKPYRCLSGNCAATKEECTEDKNLAACDAGTTRCVDGICRAKCLTHSGCPLDKPLQCANGFCASTPAECKTCYNCENQIFVRCTDGTCRSRVEDCPKIMTLAVPENVDITSSSYKDVSLEFIQNGKSSVKLGALVVPAASLNLPIGTKTPASFEDELKDKIITISPFPDSELRTGVVFKTENNDKLKKTLAKETNGDLSFYQAVRSSIVKLTSKAREAVKYRYALPISLATQKYANTDDFDYCIAELSQNKFNCVSISTKAEDLGDVTKMTFNVENDGVYAVVYSPKMTNPNPAAAAAGTTVAVTNSSDCGYWCENKGLGVFLILFGIILITLLVISLVVNGILKKRYSEAVNELGHFKNGDVESRNVKGDSESAATMKQLSDKDSQIERMRQRENVLEQEVHDLRDRVKHLVAERQEIVAE